jgi:hypothetical protein
MGHITNVPAVLKKYVIVETSLLPDPLDDLGVSVLAHKHLHRVARAKPAQNKRNERHDNQDYGQPG